MENQPPNDGGQSRMPPAKPPDQKSDKNHRKEKASAGSLYESSEDETAHKDPDRNKKVHTEPG